jgi:hypothetical protein
MASSAYIHVGVFTQERERERERDVVIVTEDGKEAAENCAKIFSLGSCKS